MGYRFKLLEILIVVCLVLLSAFTYNQVKYSEQIPKSTNTVKKFHIAVVSDHIESYSADRFLKGVETASENSDCVYELYNLQDYDMESLSKILSATEVDGAVINLENNVTASILIEKLREAGIVILTAGNDAPESGREIYIGTNKYNLGKQAALLAVEATGKSGNIAVILGSEYESTQSPSGNNFLNGIYETYSDRALYKLTEVRYSKDERAEIIIDELLKGRSPLNAVICTDPLDAIRVTRVLVDRNMVGNIKIIASGDPPEILDAIQKDLIYASVVEDYQELGELSVTNLLKSLEGESVSSYINIPIETLSKEIK